MNSYNNQLSILKNLLIYLLLGFVCGFCNDRQEKMSEKSMQSERDSMVKTIISYGIKDENVIDALRKVRRHLFIPPDYRQRCYPYGDHPCPIGYGQTISQPFIVAYMTERLKLQKGEKVLEIGTGSGYQAAILSEIGVSVYSIEIIKELAAHARNVLDKEGYDTVQVLLGSGYQGWPQHAPYDAIIVTCAPREIPESLIDELKEGGRMIIPVGKFFQKLIIIRKIDGKIIKEDDLNVRFVPMVKEK